MSGEALLTQHGSTDRDEDQHPTPAFFRAELRVDHHYCYVTIHGGEFQFKAFDQNGMLFDSFELHK